MKPRVRGRSVRALPCGRAVAVALFLSVLSAPRLSWPQGAPEPLKAAFPPSDAALEQPDRAAFEGPRYDKSHLAPALEIPASVLVLNMTDRLIGKDYAQTQGFRPLFEHLLHGPWEFDEDIFAENLIAHPYNGSIHYSFARSTGHSLWVSFAAAFGGSLLWELGGETLPPSINDQVLTPVGGTFLGEVLYRSWVLILNSGGAAPSFWHEAAAFAVNPAASFNRFMFGDAYRTIDFDERPQVSVMLGGGGGYGWRHDVPRAGGNSSGAAATTSFELSYGQPGDPGFRPRRPFDHFRLDASLTGDPDGLRETLRMQGMLAGLRLDAWRFRGVGGLFGSVEDVGGGVFRVAGAGVGAGITGQWQLGRGVALRSRGVFSGLLFGGATAIAPGLDAGGYRLGPGVQLDGDLRLFVGTALMIDAESDWYFITGNDRVPGTDEITISRFAAYLRIAGPHAVGISASLDGRGSKDDRGRGYEQGAAAATFQYAWIPDERFGAARRP